MCMGLRGIVIIASVAFALVGCVRISTSMGRINIGVRHALGEISKIGFASTATSLRTSTRCRDILR